jgi:hypothetical protein
VTEAMGGGYGWWGVGEAGRWCAHMGRALACAQQPHQSACKPGRATGRAR